MREEAGQDWLSELAAAVADGRVLEWDRLESSARDDDERASIRRLRAIAAIGVAHAELTLSESSSESLSVRTLLQGVERRRGRRTEARPRRRSGDRCESSSASGAAASATSTAPGIRASIAKSR